MTEARLKEKMLYQLRGFVKESKQASITVDTKHNKVLSDTGGQLSTAKFYKDFVRMSCKLEGTKLKQWPTDWLKKTISEVAPDLL